MATALKDIPAREYVLPGNGSCPACPATLALRIAAKAIGSNAVIVLTPSCTVASMGYTPKHAFDYPAINVCFAAAGAAGAGISASFEARAAKGRLDGELPTVFTWTGDGGTYDIGLQAASAAAERNDNIIHFCYNNEIYSNTGTQRSGATPIGAATTTTPGGKKEHRKNLPLLMLEHRIPYMATASIAYPADLYDKVLKARNTKGFKYIEIFAPCAPSWKFDGKDTIKLARLAARNGLNLLWEAEYGEITRFNEVSAALISGKRPIDDPEEYFAAQGRFKHTMAPGKKDEFLAATRRDIEEDIAFMRARAEIKIQKLHI
jgi:pyruvate ferredoxin oxidoreductase beta subunit